MKLSLVEEISAAISYSHNFATAKPNIGQTEKEHILGLCSLLSRAANESDPFDAEELHRALSGIKPVGIALGEEVILRSSVLEIARDRIGRAALQSPATKEDE
jgi:hypothetical protein